MPYNGYLLRFKIFSAFPISTVALLSLSRSSDSSCILFLQFSTLMEAANHWLRGNPNYGVWKCETVERKVEPSGQVVMESMLFHEATYGFNVHINGIR